MNQTKIVVIGGGTSTATILSGLKMEPSFELSAIVPVTDSGGSSGAFVQAFAQHRATGKQLPAIVPPGDVANALMALSQHESVLRELLNYRFSGLETPFRGHSLRNLVVDAALELWGTAGIARLSEIFRTNGLVFPASTEALCLIARLQDGTEIMGEDAIDHLSYAENEFRTITDVRITAYGNSMPAIDTGARQAIAKANLILFAPSDLWTSTVPILLVPGMIEALQSSSALRCYMVPLTTKRLNTDGYDALRLVQTLERYAFPGVVNTLLFNTTPLPTGLPGDATGSISLGNVPEEISLSVVAADLLDTTPAGATPGDIPRSVIRHDPEKVLAAVRGLISREP